MEGGSRRRKSEEHGAKDGAKAPDSAMYSSLHEWEILGPTNDAHIMSAISEGGGDEGGGDKAIRGAALPAEER